MTEWTLESELCKLTGAERIEEAMFSLGLIDSLTEVFAIEEESAWERGGAETYIYRFRVVRGEQSESEYILKACVAYSPTRSLDEILQSWVERRKLLASAGVATPKLIYCGMGLIIEEFVPFTVGEAFTQLPRETGDLLLNLASYAGVVAKLRFHAINPFGDVRSHGGDVVVVDFGQDLGNPFFLKEPNLELFKELLQALSRWNVPITAERREQLHSFFYATLIENAIA